MINSPPSPDSRWLSRRRYAGSRHTFAASGEQCLRIVSRSCISKEGQTMTSRLSLLA